MKQKRNNSRRQVLVVVVVILAVLLVAALIWKVRKASNHEAVSPSPSGTMSTSDTSVHAGPSHDSTPSPTTLPPNPSHPSSSTLGKPEGQILSSRTAPMSANEESTCISVAGASCYIQATMNGKVVAVSATKTITNDQQGVIFDWPVSKLSPGTWAVQAVASKDGQKALSDPWTLTVTQ